jgi:hypothetical protein
MRRQGKVLDGRYVHAIEEDWPHLVRISHRDVWDALPADVKERVGYRDFAVIQEVEYALSVEYHVMSKAFTRLKNYGKDLDEWVTENLARDLTGKFDENNARVETALDKLAVADQIRDNTKAQKLLQGLRELIYAEDDKDDGNAG